METKIRALLRAQRVSIVGWCGAGKSTLARELGMHLQLPTAHLDQFFFNPNWKELPTEEWKQRHAMIIKQKRWVFDGNNSLTFLERAKRADVVIFLDFPRWLCMTRIFRRSCQYYGVIRPDMAQGCPERFSFEFYKYVWNMKHRSIPKFRAFREQTKHETTWLTLHSPKEVRKFWKQLKSLTPSSNRPWEKPLLLAERLLNQQKNHESVGD